MYSQAPSPKYFNTPLTGHLTAILWSGCLSILGRNIYVTLIARRSRHYAGPPCSPMLSAPYSLILGTP